MTRISAIQATATITSNRSAPLILLASQSGIALQVLYGVAATGAAVHVIGGARAAYLRFARSVASFTQVELPPEAAPAPLVPVIAALADRVGARMVVPGDDYATTALVRLAGVLPVPVFPCPAPATHAELADKWRFFNFCRAHGVPVPETLWVGDKAALDPEALGERLGYPLVVKPVDQGNMNGVAILRSAAELQARVIDNPAYRYGRLIAQAFIPGSDIDCSVLAREGRVLAIAIQRRTGWTIGFVDCPPLAESVTRIIRASRFTGLAHFDARQGPAAVEVQLVECNPRVWASMDAARWCGLNFMAAGLEPSCGEPTTKCLADGSFTPWAGMLLSAMKLDFAGFRSAPSRRGLYQAVKDPLPVLAEQALGLRRHLRRRRTAA